MIDVYVVLQTVLTYCRKIFKNVIPLNLCQILVGEEDKNKENISFEKQTRH